MPETITDLSRRIAEWIGDEGFLPAKTCTQGHSNFSSEDQDFYHGVGELCGTCLFGDVGAEAAWALSGFIRGREPKPYPATPEQEKDRSWHPEWRIPRGDPKHYAESLDLLMPVVERWCRRHAIEGDIPNFGITFVQQPTDEEAWWNAEIWELDDVWGFTPAEALAHALVAAVDRWGW